MHRAEYEVLYCSKQSASMECKACGKKTDSRLCKALTEAVYHSAAFSYCSASVLGH